MVRLDPLRESHLSTIDTWFEDEETRRWLGGPGWGHETLRLSESEPGRRAYVAVIGERVVALLDVETEPSGRAASFAMVVDPRCRRQGIAGSTIRAMLTLSGLAGVDRFWCGIENGNDASERLVRRCGFVPSPTRSEAGFRDLEFRRRE